MSEESLNAELLSLTAEIVSAHVSNNSVGIADLPMLIEQVHSTLANLGKEPEKTPPSVVAVGEHRPAAP